MTGQLKRVARSLFSVYPARADNNRQKPRIRLAVKRKRPNAKEDCSDEKKTNECG